MRIIIINSTSDLYGANRILNYAILGFPHSTQVEILLPTLEGPFIDLLKKSHKNLIIRSSNTLPIVQRNMFSIKGFMKLLSLMYFFYIFLKNENKKQKIDLLYVNTLSNFFVLPISWLLNIKTLIHIHEILDEPKFIAKVFSKYSVWFSDYVLCVSEAVRQGLFRWIRTNQYSKVSVVHNGIPDLFNASELNTDLEVPIITYIGRIKPEKGVWFFLGALMKLTDYKNVKVRIIGGPAPFGEHYINKLKNDITEMSLDVEYIPFVTDVSQYLNNTDILVVPSLMKDSFPTTVLEGMSCGKVVIATNTGGAAEAIAHGVNGVLLTDFSEENFASALNLLLADPNKRFELGNSARKTFVQKFSLDIFTNNLNQFFSKILDEK